MKSRKKFLFLLASLSSLSFAVALSSCDISGLLPNKEPEHIHTYGEWTETLAPTCTTDGKIERACECGAVEKDEVSQLGHDFQNFVSDENAKCTKDGTKTGSCARPGCDEIRTVVDEGSKLPHDYAETVVAPTCASQGYTTYLCSCGDTYVGNYKEKG